MMDRSCNCFGKQVLGNADDRVLAIYELIRQQLDSRYVGTSECNITIFTTEEIKDGMLKYLGRNTVLVLVNVGLILAALNLVLHNHRVVDLGSEVILQFINRNIADIYQNFRYALIDNMLNSYNRRIPAVLCAV